MRSILTIIAILATVAVAAAADKPIIYNLATPPRTELDEAVNAGLSSRFRIVEILDATSYAPPTPIAGSLPRSARTVAGEELAGTVMVGYAITAEGLVAEPFVISSTDKRLDAFALHAMKGWRFSPARLNGVAVATSAAQEFVFEVTAASKYVEQLLAPTGGKILRPREWFYTESHHGSSYNWILSREDATRNPYVTGVRIQALVGVQKQTGTSGRDFVRDFVAGKKNGAVKIIKSCPEKEQGLFTRICLETEEGPYHILYSLFWGTDNLDVVIISIAGTTKALWNTYAPVFDTMSAFELIDMERLGE